MALVQAYSNLVSTHASGMNKSHGASKRTGRQKAPASCGRSECGDRRPKTCLTTLLQLHWNENVQK